MIKRLHVKNYKSFKEMEVELGKFNVIIGPNASGKSNFIELLKFISSKEFFDEFLTKLGGFSAVTFACNQQPIEIAIDFSLNNHYYSYTFRIKKFRDSTILDFEKLIVDGTPIFEVKTDEDRYSVMIKGKKDSISGLPLGKQILRYEMNDINIRLASDFITSINTFNFSPKAMRSTCGIRKQYILSEDGSNLAQVLHTLLTERRKVFDEIESTLKEAIPEVEELLTPIEKENEVSIGIREKGFDVNFSYHQISDGTFRLLAYITALHTDSYVLAFEEPEVSIHPWLLELLINLLKSSDKQIILTTHSPALLNHVSVDDIIVIEKQNGQSIFRRIRKKEELNAVKRLLEEGVPLGEQWMSNVFGGVP